jgi:hypothetical protein
MKRFVVILPVSAPDDADESEVAHAVNECLDLGLGEFTSRTEEIELPEAAAEAQRLLKLTFGEPEASEIHPDKKELKVLLRSEEYGDQVFPQPDIVEAAGCVVRLHRQCREWFAKDQVVRRVEVRP